MNKTILLLAIFFQVLIISCNQNTSQKEIQDSEKETEDSIIAGIREDSIRRANEEIKAANEATVSEKIYIYDTNDPMASYYFEDYRKAKNSISLTVKEFYGAPYNVPIKCYVTGDVSALEINHNKFNLTRGDNFIRVNLNLELGYNEVPIHAWGALGLNSMLGSSGKLHITVEPQN